MANPPARPTALQTAVLPGARAARPVAAAAPSQPAPISGARQPLEFGPNQQIGRFGLIREIARGGMGQVFLARDTKLGRKVAIKFLLHDDPNFVSRFVIEARATARCTHENIVTIFEVGEHQGLPFMVLEFLEGRTLSQVLEQKPSVRQFTEIMVSVVRALERAHEHGIVHRDLKPSNIFVTDRGTVKVLDFGVAKCFDGSAEAADHIASPVASTRMMDAVVPHEEHTYVTFSANGSLVGTLPYMSPEQWGADTVDHLSDIWAVGIMFWRAMTGVHPAGTMTPDKLRERLTDLATPLPSIASKEPSFPRHLAMIVDRCLAKAKAQRYPSATELLADLTAYLSPRSAQFDEDHCPYRGLAAFGEGDAKNFFGRSAEIRTAMAQLAQWPLLAVIGPSGVGKSSFVHAGLVPAIRAGLEPITSPTQNQHVPEWHVRVVRPGRAPISGLADVLVEEGLPQELIASVIGNLAESPGHYGEVLRREASAKRYKLLIVVDQLEELFTMSPDDHVHRAFLAALLGAADDPASPVRVVLSMRADFLDRLATHKHFLGELSRGLFFLSAPDHDNLRETLVRPAEAAGYQFEDLAIVEHMLHSATSRGALPLLQFAATRMWDTRDRARRLLTKSAYDAMGGVGGAFARHADEVAAAIPPQHQPLLRAIMSRLVTPEGTRAVVDQRELASLSTEPAIVEAVLDQLVRGRLIHLHTDPTHGATVEIVHEVLITEWPTLARWLEDTHALRGFVHELRTAAKQWAARGRPTDLVWRGGTAQEALAITKRHVLDLAADERAFVAAIKSEASKGRRRKVMGVTAVFAVLGLVLAGGSVMYFRVSHAEQVAQERAADAEAKEAKIQEQLDIVNGAKAKVAAANTEAATAKTEAERAAEERAKAETAVLDTKEDLARANKDLKKSLEEAQRERVKAQQAAREADEQAKKARDASELAKAATAEAKRLLAEQQARVKQLELEKSKIVTGGLH